MFKQKKIRFLIFIYLQLDAQRSRREEAMMVADAFRIAFEQQLRKRSEHFLLLAEANILKSHHCKAEGESRDNNLLLPREGSILHDSCKYAPDSL